MLADSFGPNSIAIVSERLQFDVAVQRATELLVLDQKATTDYVQEVLQNLRELGPYFVVAPGIALAHAKPSASVSEAGFSLLKLDSGSESGSVNDPVQLLFAFCSPSANSHIELLGDFASIMSEPEKVNLLLNASAESVIRDLLY